MATPVETCGDVRVLAKDRGAAFFADKVDGRIRMKSLQLSDYRRRQKAIPEFAKLDDQDPFHRGPLVEKEELSPTIPDRSECITMAMSLQQHFASPSEVGAASTVGPDGSLLHQLQGALA
jgi:hypothetical protein